MKNIVAIICIVFAFVLFAIGTFGPFADVTRVRLIAAGLMFLALAELCMLTGLGQ